METDGLYLEIEEETGLGSPPIGPFGEIPCQRGDRALRFQKTAVAIAKWCAPVHGWKPETGRLGANFRSNFEGFA